MRYVPKLSAVLAVFMLLVFSLSDVSLRADLNSRLYIGEEADYIADFEQVKRLIAEGQWEQALNGARRLLHACEEWETAPPGDQDPKTLMVPLYSDGYPRRGDSGLVGSLFVPLRQEVLGLLAEMPLEQLRAYQREASPRAATLLTEARTSRERGLVQRVADRYWLTDVGPEALDLAAQLAFEAGEYTTAAYYWEQLMGRYESVFSRDPARAVLLATCYRAIGDRRHHWLLSLNLGRRFRQASGHLGHQYIEDVAAAIDPERQGMPVPGMIGPSPWLQEPGLPMLGGNTTRSQPSPAFSRLVEAYPPLPLSELYTSADTDNSMNPWGQRQVIPSNSRAARNLRNSFPVCRNGRLLITGPRSGLIAQLPAPGASQPGQYRRYPFNVDGFLGQPPEPADNNRFWGNVSVEPRFHLPAIHENRGYVVLHPSDLRVNPNTGRPMTGWDALVCVNLQRQGAIEWVTPSTELDDPNLEIRDFLAQVRFGDGFVITEAGMMVVPATLSTTGEVRYYLIGLDPATGAVRWYRKVASAMNENTGWGGWGSMIGNAPTLSPLAASGGFVTMVTNMGAVVTVDALTGAIRWVFVYDQAAAASQRMNPFVRSSSGDQPSAGWFPNAPIIHGGNVFFTPTDAEKLFACELRTGELLCEYPEGKQSAHEARAPNEGALDLEYTLGVAGNILHIQGRHRLIGINLLRFQQPPGVINREILVAYKSVPYVSRMMPTQPGTSNSPVSGRGVLTLDAIFVPLERGLVRYSATSGRRESDVIPWPGMLPSQPPVGHLTVVETPDSLRGTTSPNRYPTGHLQEGDVTLPRDFPGEDPPTGTVARRLYLLVTGPESIQVIAVE